MCGEHIQELSTVYLTRFRTYKIALPPIQKPRRGGGLRQIKTPAAKYHYWSYCKKSLHLRFESISYLADGSPPQLMMVDEDKLAVLA